MKRGRMIIYTKDVQRIYGKSDRSARALLARIRKHLNKQRHQPITVSEFCTYLNVSPDEVISHILD
jgi:hypothetical protein